MSEKIKQKGVRKPDATVHRANVQKTLISKAWERLIYLSNRKSIQWIVTALGIVSVLTYYATDSNDQDIWFHLRYGEYYIRNLTWAVDHTIFSWTPADPGWKYVTWIGSSLLCIAYRIGSVPGLYILQWLIFSALLFICWYYIRSIGDRFDINNSAWIMLIAAALAPTASIIKPELFTILFFTITVFLYFYTFTASKNYLFLYPVLFFLWVNTHGGFIFGLFFLTLAVCLDIASFLISKRYAPDKRRLKVLILSVLFSYLATLLNPHGIFYHLQLWSDLTSKEYMGFAAKLYAYTDLWKVLFPKVHTYMPWISAWSMVFLFGIFLVVTLFCYRKYKVFNATLLVLNLSFFYLGMSKSRASIFFPVLGFFSVSHLLKNAGALELRKKFSPVSAFLSICLMIMFFYHYAAYGTQSWFGSNMEETVPVKESAFIRENKLEGPLFNDYLTGGYMLWAMYPDYKVFIDPRMGPYVKKVLPDWLKLKDKSNLTPGGLTKFLADYPFKTVLLNLSETDCIIWLLRSPEWKLAYFDRNAVVIVHTSVFNSMKPEALKLNLGPERFTGIDNPSVLLNLFNFYLVMKPEFARDMLSIYEKNVSGLYRFREETLRAMEGAIASREFQMRQVNQNTR